MTFNRLNDESIKNIVGSLTDNKRTAGPLPLDQPWPCDFCVYKLVDVCSNVLGLDLVKGLKGTVTPKS